MKVLVKFTVDVTDEERKALAWRNGADDDSMAKHADVASFYALRGTARGAELVAEAMKEYYRAKAAFYAEKASEGTTGAQGTG